MQPLLHLLLDFLVILALIGLLLSRLVDLMLRRAAPKQTKWLAFTFPFALIAYFSICFAEVVKAIAMNFVNGRISMSMLARSKAER